MEDTADILDWMAGADDDLFEEQDLLTRKRPAIEDDITGPTIPQSDGASDNLNSFKKIIHKKLKRDTTCVAAESTFLSRIAGMWSPTQTPRDEEPPKRPSFFYSPPRPTSPTKTIADDEGANYSIEHDEAPNHNCNPDHYTSWILKGKMPASPRLLGANDTIIKTHLSQISTGKTASRLWTWAESPPSNSNFLESILAHGLPPVVYEEPHFSDADDAPTKSKIIAGRVRRLPVKNDSMSPYFHFSAIKGNDEAVNMTATQLKSISIPSCRPRYVRSFPVSV